MFDYDLSPTLLRSTPRPYVRRLSDKIFLAFDQACETGELDTAHSLLMILEGMFTRPSPHPKQDRRKNIESVVAAYQRLWALRQIQAQEGKTPFWHNLPAQSEGLA